VNKYVGQRIKQERTTRKWSTERLAHESGLGSTARINSYERSDRGIYVHVLAKIAEALGVHPAELFPSHPVDTFSCEEMENFQAIAWSRWNRARAGSDCYPDTTPEQ
jgi:transcriptional regulator with XRE-family HTH domain